MVLAGGDIDRAQADQRIPAAIDVPRCALAGGLSGAAGRKAMDMAAARRGSREVVQSIEVDGDALRPEALESLEYLA